MQSQKLHFQILYYTKVDLKLYIKAVSFMGKLINNSFSFAPNSFSRTYKQPHISFIQNFAQNFVMYYNTFFVIDSRRAIQLYLLAPLIPPKTRTKIKKLHWKPSVTEAREGYLIHVCHPGDIEKAKKCKIDAMFAKGLTVQPYIIIVGQNLNNITQALVVINEHTYSCQSVLEALDFCFKAFIVLDAQYPFQSQHIWYLIQWLVYKISTQRDPKILFVNDILNFNNNDNNRFDTS